MVASATARDASREAVELTIARAATDDGQEKS